jgi:hypothetical protein
MDETTADQTKPALLLGLLAGLQGLDGLLDPGRPGLRFLRLGDPAHPLLAMGEGQAVEEVPG